MVFWVYAAASVVLLLTLMFIIADRTTQPTTGFEPVSTAEPANEFLPADRSISECISAIPKPGCGSDARGGWHQAVVLLAVLVGLAVIAWRVVVGARRARRDQLSSM